MQAVFPLPTNPVSVPLGFPPFFGAQNIDVNFHYPR